MRAYRASNEAPFVSVILLLIVAVIAGAVIGGILWGVEHFTNFYLIVAFPIFAGFLAGLALAFVVKVGKIRSPIIAIFAGLVAALVMYGVYHFASYYITFRGQVQEVAVEQQLDLTDAEIDAFINEQLELEFGSSGFIGYMQLAAREGFSITRATSSSSSGGLEISGAGVWIYWGVEILLAAALAASAASSQAGEPFDENVGQWYGPLTVIAKGSPKVRKEMVDALNGGDYETAGRLLGQNPDGASLDVGVRRSPDAASQDIMLVVREQNGRNTTEIQKGLVDPTELQRFTRALEAAAPQTSA